MTERDRRLTTTRPPNADPSAADQAPSGPLRHRHAPSTGIANRLARPHSREEAEARYIEARDAWSAAMRTANSGRSTDLAALAIAQEAYEEALADRERWASSPSVAITVGDERPSSLDAVVGQELSWRRVHEHELEVQRAREQPRGLRGLLRRIGRR